MIDVASASPMGVVKRLRDVVVIPGQYDGKRPEVLVLCSCCRGLNWVKGTMDGHHWSKGMYFGGKWLGIGWFMSLFRPQMA